MDRDILDRIYAKTEVDPEIWKSLGFDKDSLTWKVSENLKAILTITARVELLAPGGIERAAQLLNQ